MYHAAPANRFANARPAGASDEDSDSSGDGFYRPVLANNGNNANATSGDGDGPSGAMGGWQAEEDWEPAPEAPVPVDEGGQDEQSPAEAIRLACMRGSLDKLKELLSGEDSAAWVNKFFPGSGENPLIIASSRGQAEIVEFLLEEKKANPDLRHSIQKTTALMAMVGCYREDGDEDVLLRGIAALVAAGADLNLQDRHGVSALVIAIKRRRAPVVKYLLEKGADPNLTDPDGQTALIIAAMDGVGPLCRLLLEHNADVHLVNRFGFTASDLAQHKKHSELAKLLYIAQETKWRPGADPTLMEQIGQQAPQKAKPDANDNGAFVPKEDMCIDLLLNAVDGSNFLSNFRKRKMTYAQFLRLDEDQLKEMGVDEIGVREGIMEKIKQIQNAEWRNSSIKMVAENKMVTAAEAACIITNTDQHLEHISSSLKYLQDRISRQPLALRHEAERNKLIDLMEFCKQMEELSFQLRNDAVGLYKLFDSLGELTELQISGTIPKRTFKDFKNNGSSPFRNIIAGLSVTAGVGLVLYGTFKGYWSWRK